MSDEPLRLTLLQVGSQISASGDLDAHSAAHLLDTLDPLPGEGRDDIELDLKEVTFVDSSGLRVIIDTHQRAAAVDRRLVITNPSRAVRRLIEISGLSELLYLSAAG